MQYRRIVKNGFNKGELIPLNDNIFEHIDTEEPNYSSIFHYNDKQFEIFKAKGSVKGLKNVQTNKLVWDFDVTGEENKRLKTMELVREETIELCSRLLELGFPEDSIQIYFSGGKGFHVEIDVNEDLSVDDFKGIIFGVAKGLELDEKIKDPNRIFRIPLTRHQETNLYKFPIIFKSLKEYNVDKIIEKVKKIDEFDLDRHIERIKLYKRVNIPEHVYEYRLKEKAQKEPESETILMDISGIDFSKKPPGFTNCKWAIANGFFPKGKRNESMMALTTLCQSLNYSKEQSYYLCKNALRKRQERTGQEFDKTDLWIEVINYVYDDDWSGVIYTCTSPEHWLYTYCEALGEHSCSNQHDDTRLKTIVQVKDKFAYFAKNIDKNTIKFGIPKLDNNVRLVTGMLVGWLGAPGAGKCLGKGTEIRMYDGTLKNVEEIQVGDLLMGDNSTPRKVLSTCQGKENLYKIKQVNGDDYIVNESHILSLKNNVNFNDFKRKKQFENKIIDIPLKDYLSKGKLFKKHYKGYKVEIEYPKRNLELNPYIMGIWLGDGTSSKPEITTNDIEILDYFKKELCDNLNLKIKTYSRNNQYTFVSKNLGEKNIIKESNIFLNHLKGYEVLNNKHIPFVYKINSRENRLKLLAGLIDSDGFYDKRKNYYEITFKNKKLMDDTIDLCRSLGFRCSMNEKIAKYNSFTKNKLYKGETLVYRLYLSGEKLYEIPVLLNRKKAKKINQKTDKSLTSIQVESLGIGDYYGFEINGNKRFLLKDYTVTHNTSVILDILKYTSMNGEDSMFYSLDMTDELVYTRLVQNETGLDSEEIFEYHKNDKIARKVEQAGEAIHKKFSNVKICSRSGSTVEDIERDLKNYEEKTGRKVRLLVVDYLEKIKGKYSDPTATSGLVASQLNDLARTHNVCVVLLLQPQKSAGDPSEPLLTMRKIKGASVIEQDCRVIMTLWRPGFNPEDSDYDEFACIAVVKNNMGRLGRYDFHWNGVRGKIRELTPHEAKELKALEKRKADEKEQDDF